MKLQKLYHFILITFLLAFFSCSTSTISQRIPSSSTDQISYYLSVDKFKYYINEYSIAFEGKIPDDIITELRNIRIEDILAQNIDHKVLSDAQNYDDLIYNYLSEKNKTFNLSKNELKWNYNFFRTKLNEAFTLSSSKLDINTSLDSSSFSSKNETLINPELLSADDMTLDSGHYISNRTTRAIFWEAIENNRTIEFHLGDSREFLKQLKLKNGEIINEVRPLAKNYNKIFIVKYPGEDTYRYAITNIGGNDRLNHLTHQVSLSNIKGHQLKNKIVVIGNLKKFHEAKTQEHTLQLKLLPKADRVIIGQKESIDGKFNLFWKVRALKNLYDDDPSLFEKRLDKKLRDKFFTIEKSPFETVFKDKKIIEDAYIAFEDIFTEDSKYIPSKFKIYNFDNFTIEMCDYVFKDSHGKSIRWRVVSNVWGDEIIPIAQAFKNTNHKNIVYMGTAGAFADKGYKVGDLVVPSAVQDNEGRLEVKSKAMQIDGAKYGGSVEHVGSPFEESKDWLTKSRIRSELVEVETSYLRRIFNSPTDNVEMYLLISDILGSDTETLAHATSSKRKNAQNKLLAKLFERDSLGFPTPTNVNTSSLLEKNKALVFSTLSGKTNSYKYYIYSLLKNNSSLTEDDILKLSNESPAFTDNFILDRLVKIGEILQQLKLRNNLQDQFEIAFSKSLALGTWNPKVDKINITLKAKDAETEKKLAGDLASLKTALDKISGFAEIQTSTKIQNTDLIWMKIPEKFDSDFFVKIYSLSGLKNAGLYQKVTYNGNLTLDFLPTSQTEQPLESFYQGSGSNSNCNTAISSFLSLF